MTAVNNNAIAEWKAGLTTYWRDAITAGELPETDLDIGVGHNRCVPGNIANRWNGLNRIRHHRRGGWVAIRHCDVLAH